MAKRRKLEAPSADEMNRIEAEISGGVGRRNTSAPIAQVAAESAGAYDPRSAGARAVDARDRTDAERLREAQGKGLVILEIPIDEINADALVRDRVVLNAEEMDELRQSIENGGLRLPIEVFEPGEGPHRYGLLSGYRRLKAIRDLRTQSGDDRYLTIKAILREPAAMGGTFAAMVEENEIRAGLSQFERGRIAVIAAQQGAFGTTEDAVSALFPAASKAKRSKIRSFALIFEEIGDMLTFPDAIKEKDGLKLSAALRDGAGDMLRTALADAVPASSAEEAVMLKRALATITSPKRAPARGGRPSTTSQGRRVVLPSGIALRSAQDKEGWMIRMSGQGLDEGLIDEILNEVAHILARR